MLFLVVVNVITENVRKDVANDVLYTDILVFMSETMEDFERRILNRKEVLESKGLKINIGKAKVMVCWSKVELHKSKIDPCRVCVGPSICRTRNVETEFMTDVRK